MPGVFKNVIKLIRTAWFLLKTTSTAWFEDNATSQGAALAFYAVVSLAPLLVVVMSLAGVIYGEKAAAGEIVRQTQSLSGFNSAGVVNSVLHDIKDRGLGLGAGIIGIFTVLAGATGVFVELQNVLDKIWKVKAESASGIGGLIRTRILSFVLVLATVILLVLSLASSAGLAIVDRFAADQVHIPAALSRSSGSFLTFAIATLLIAAVFKLLPDTHVAWSDVWAGAVLTAILFTLGKMMLGTYLGESRIATAYGAAGSFLTLLVWVYYSAQVLLFGAEFTHVYATRRGSRAGHARAA